MAYLVIFLGPLSGLAIDIYTPALPTLETTLHISASVAKSSIAIYLLFFGLSQLLWGGLSDIYGRKNILLTGLYLFSVSSLSIAIFVPITKSASLLMALRASQGVAIAAIGITARATLIDLFTGEIFKRLVNSATIAWAITPIIAPILGAALLTWFNWNACFYFLAAYAIIGTLLTHLILIRTNKKTPFNVPIFIKNTTRLIKDREYSSALILVTLTYSALSIFYVTGPFIIQKTLEHSPIFFGHCSGVIGLAWLSGNILTKLIQKNNKKISIRLVILTLALLCAPSYFLFNSVPLLWLYMTFLCLYTAGVSSVFPTVLAYCLNQHRDIAGTVSAITGASFWFLSGVASTTASLINLDHRQAIFDVYTVLTLLILLTYYYYIPKRSELRS